jgi:hypothetical protein
MACLDARSSNCRIGVCCPETWWDSIQIFTPSELFQTYGATSMSPWASNRYENTLTWAQYIISTSLRLVTRHIVQAQPSSLNGDMAVTWRVELDAIGGLLSKKPAESKSYTHRPTGADRVTRVYLPFFACHVSWYNLDPVNVEYVSLTPSSVVDRIDYGDALRR